MKFIKYLIIIVLIAVVVGTIWLYKKEQLPIVDNPSNEAVVSKPIDTSTWTNYVNEELGFSILVPLEVSGKVRCSDMQPTNVPVKIFEDNQNSAVYITQEYYYDAWDRSSEKMTEQCEKINSTLGSLRSGYVLGWKIIINNVKDDEEILKYIKVNFGSTCMVANKTLRQDGNYAISLIGSDAGKNGEPWYGSCFLGFVYKILYSPEKQRLMSVVLGQECKFGTNPAINPYKCYDDTMIQSFKFK
ncbi:MAG: hypothetical protein WC470_01135 [Candidatus Paceibacterota bacterium]